MRLSTKIPFVTGFVLILTVAVNLIAFQKIADRLVPVYQQELDTANTTPNPDKLRAFTELSELDDQTRQEYSDAINELSTISTALQNISNNPELYVGGTSGSTTPSSTSISISNASGSTNKYSFLANITLKKLSENTPEGHLIRGILQNMFIVNVLWLLCVYFFYMMWIRSVFSPVERVTHNIDQITENGAYSLLDYTKDDEFLPLISSINHLHESLSLQERIRSNFLSDISHEIRTPITAVKCYLEAIEDGVMELDHRTILLFKTELDRLAETTDGILEFENTTHSIEHPIRVERFGIKKLLLPLIQQYQPQLQKSEQTIEVSLPTDATIRMDEGMFLQIIHNIFSNFIKYAGKGSTLTCSYHRSKTETVLSFIDNGNGIPEKDLPFVKEKFYRVDRGRSRTDNKSMGIGLSIIDHIMRNHGGKFVISNTSPHGLSIQLHFPR